MSQSRYPTPEQEVAVNESMKKAAALPTVRQVNPLTDSRSRKFKLVRDDDETGISGTGVVAEGIEFSNGMCAMCWLTAMHSVAVYPNVRQLEAIHGHNGRARVVFDA